MKTELLAPAGDIEAAYSAFYYGADAVYLGLRQFSARAEAVNFAPEELDEITAYAHANGKKVYVTVNTVIQENELPNLIEVLKVCDKYRVDAVIVQDLGVARLVRQSFPNLELHASTQMAVHNLSGALALKKIGFRRVVLARELSLNEIQYIKNESGLEIEVFVHGALCYSYSGLCLFSSLTTGRSANRGKCVYSCRDIFRLNGRQYHPFSMKDMALEKDVLKLEGISLKIEGRKKNALYVGAVTDYYRRILDTGKINIGLTDNLKQIFARPWTKLHFNGRKKDVIEPDFVGHRGLEIGIVDKVFNQTITFKPNRAIARYDGVQIDVTGQEKPFGFSAENLTVNGKKVFEVPAGQTVTLTLPPRHPFIQKESTVYLASSTRVKGSYPYVKPRPNEFKNRTDIEVSVYVQSDKIMACTDGVISEIQESFTKAKNVQKVSESIQKAFEKTGDTQLSLKELMIQNPDDLFVPASVLNELRRQLYGKISIPEKEIVLPNTPLLKRKKKTEPLWIMKTDDLNLAEKISDFDELVFVLSPTITPNDLNKLPKDKIRLALPAVMRPEQLWKKTVDSFLSAGYQKWEIGNPAGFTLLPKSVDITLDSTITMMNTQAVEQALENGVSRITFSVEDTGDNIKALSEKTKQTAFVLYQDIPLFISDNCVRENDCRLCDKKRLETELMNGKGQYRLISERCQTVVISEQAFAVPPKERNLPVGAYRIDFCYRHYTVQQALSIIENIKNGRPVPRTNSGNFDKQFAK